MKKLAKCTLVLLAALPLVGNAEIDNPPTTALGQGLCPVMEGNPIDPALHVDYQGERVYFCCKTCVKLFSENPEQYLKNLPQAVAGTHSEGESHDHATGHGEGGVHNHETDHAAPESRSRLIPFLGKFHPIAVHIPIALILVAALAEALFLFTGVPLFRSAARFNLIIAVLGAVAAVPLGLAAASGTQYPADYAVVLFRHKALGFATLGLTLTAATLSERLHRKGAGTGSYRIALLLCVLLVGATGHLGGLLVYGLNHFSW